VGCHYCPDDCGEDCECADCDIDSFRAALGCTDPDPCYNSQWDFDGDGDVDFSDLATYGDYCDDC
jgi:hypothetical protein